MAVASPTEEQGPRGVKKEGEMCGDRDEAKTRPGAVHAAEASRITAEILSNSVPCPNHKHF